MSTTAKSRCLLSEIPASVEVSDYGHDAILLHRERARELRRDI